jgi:hypothetical protein
MYQKEGLAVVLPLVLFLLIHYLTVLSLAKIVSIVGDWIIIERGWSGTGKGELKYSEIPVSMPVMFLQCIPPLHI